MDEQQLKPRSFAWSAASGSLAHARPSRPITFTPSRTEPIAPPQGVMHPATTAGSLRRLGVWLLLALGWLVFFSWWGIVLRRESLAALGNAFGLLAAILVTSAVAMMLWIGHNVRRARKGKRGQASLYIPMRWEHDPLGRPLDLPASATAHAAAEVRVEMRDGVKTYVAAGKSDRSASAVHSAPVQKAAP